MWPRNPHASHDDMTEHFERKLPQFLNFIGISSQRVFHARTISDSDDHYQLQGESHIFIHFGGNSNPVKPAAKHREPRVEALLAHGAEPEERTEACWDSLGPSHQSKGKPLDAVSRYVQAQTNDTSARSDLNWSVQLHAIWYANDKPRQHRGTFSCSLTGEMVRIEHDRI